MTFIKKLSVAGLAYICISCTSGPTQPVSVGKCDIQSTYNISAARFDETAQQLAHGTGCFIETNPALTGAVKVKPVKGTMTIREAVHTATQGTSLTVTNNQPDSITVR